MGSRRTAPSGLAVDVLNEAARRRGIRLTWVPLHDVPLDAALEKRMVQLWPLVAATADRNARFYVSEPWLENSYILVSLREHPVRNADEAAGKVVAQARLRFTTIIADKYLPRSRKLVRVFREQAIQSLCGGAAQAAIVESRVMDTFLLVRPAGCESASFHMAALPGATSPLAIAAVPEIAASARALRDEISHLTADGFLGRKLDEWSPFSAEGTRSIWAEQEAKNRAGSIGPA